MVLILSLVLVLVLVALSCKLGFGWRKTMSKGSKQSSEKRENVPTIYEIIDARQRLMPGREVGLATCQAVAQLCVEHNIIRSDVKVLLPGSALAALCTFAKRELESTAEDDETPLDPEWLEKMDFSMLPADAHSPSCPWREVGKEGVTCGVLWWNNEWQFIIESPDCSVTVILKVVQTRGDVRRLFYALDN